MHSVSGKLFGEVKYDEELKKWVIEVEKAGEKFLLGHINTMGDVLFEYEKYDSRQDAVNYIKKSDKLELKLLDINKCKAWIMDDTTTVISENERQTLDWYMDYTGCNFNEIFCKECSLNELYLDNAGRNLIKGKDIYETIGDGMRKYFKNEVVTEPFIICSTEY